MLRAFLHQRGFRITRRNSTTLKLNPLFQFQFPPTFSTATSTSDSSHTFAVSYLINNLGFSPESALRLSSSNRIRFKTSQNPDSVLTFFRNHSFPDSDTRIIITKEPWLLSCNAHKRVLPKFQFLLSKGASPSDVVRIVRGSPRFLQSSLENRIVPAYNLVHRFLQSQKFTLVSIISCPSLLYVDFVARNIKLLVGNGVASSIVFRILRLRPSILCACDLGETVQELKHLGFDPSKSYFGTTLLAKRGASKSKSNEKIDTYKRWGWSEEAILEAFKKQPLCMISSSDKINRLMRFWVDQLGWESSYLVKSPFIFSYSLEKRLIPRASVVHYLVSKGLRSERASLITPFLVTEKLFMKNYVTCFEEEESSQLLKLYRGKMNVEDDQALGNRKISCS